MRDLEIAAFIEARLTVLQYAAEAADRAGHWQNLAWPESHGITGVTEEHILAHSPKAVLADIAAKRERLRLLQIAWNAYQDSRRSNEPFEAFARGDACGRFVMALRMVALDAAVWREHPDYQARWADPGWRPEA